MIWAHNEVLDKNFIAWLTNSPFCLHNKKLPKYLLPKDTKRTLWYVFSFPSVLRRGSTFHIHILCFFVVVDKIRFVPDLCFMIQILQMWCCNNRDWLSALSYNSQNQYRWHNENHLAHNQWIKIRFKINIGNFTKYHHFMIYHHQSKHLKGHAALYADIMKFLDGDHLAPALMMWHFLTELNQRSSLVTFLDQRSFFVALFTCPTIEPAWD